MRLLKITDNIGGELIIINNDELSMVKPNHHPNQPNGNARGWSRPSIADD